MSALPADIIIREFESIGECKRSEALQRAVWGEDDPADNADLLLAIQHEGGLVAGAFQTASQDTSREISGAISHNQSREVCRQERMVGFIFGFPTRDPAVQHSHRLAVHPDCRGMGLGVAMKWFQRQWCQRNGIRLVRWTYDPLLAVNASLNIDTLGATAGIYHMDYYGEMVGINAGVPSDRLLAEWQLDAPAVEQLATQKQAVSDRSIHPERRVSIPADFPALLVNEPGKARSERLRVRHELQSAFSGGYRIVAFDRDELCYRLSRSQ